MLLYKTINLVNVIENNDIDLLKRIVKKEHTIIIESINNQGLLHLAVQKGHKTIVRYLIEKGVDLTIRDQHYNSIAHTAIIAGHDQLALDILKLQSATISNYININTQNNNNSTLLHLAAKGGYFKIVKLLCCQNIGLNIKDFHGNTALNIAVQEGHVRIVKYLLTHDANHNTPDRYGNTPLYYAIYKNYQHIESLLLEKGANPIMRPIAKDNAILFKLVMEHNDEELINILDNTEVDVNALEIYGNTPLHLAVLFGTSYITSLLLRYKADPNMRNNHNDTVLHVACLNDNKEAIKCLIENGAEINTFNKFGQTPIECLVNIGDLEMVVLLLQKGAIIGNALRSISKKTSKELIELVQAEDILQKIQEATFISLKTGIRFNSIKEEDIQYLLKYKEDKWKKHISKHDIIDKNCHEYIQTLFFIKKFLNMHPDLDNSDFEKLYSSYIKSEGINQPIISLKIQSLDAVNKYYDADDVINNAVIQDILTQHNIDILGIVPPADNLN